MSLILSGSDGVSDIDGSASTPAIRGTDANTGIFFPAADTIGFAEGGAEAMRIDSSGNVGVGTSTIRGRLTVSDGAVNTAGEAVYQAYIAGTSRTPTSDVTAMLTIQSTNALAANVGGSIAFGGRAVSGSDAGANWATIAGFKETATTAEYGGYLQFATRPNSGAMAERARITSGGGFLLGTTTAGAGWGAGGTVLTVDEAATFGVIKNAGGSSSPVLLIWNATGTTDNGFLTFATETGGSTRGSIDYNRTGGLTRYNTTSDATLKNIIGDADNQKSVEILNSTRIREFAWKDDATQKPQIGVIAQELYETYKGAVSVGGDVEQTDEEGNVTTKYNPWGVDKTAFTFHLVAGWQAHEKKIAEQQAKIDALEARLAALENK